MVSGEIGLCNTSLFEQAAEIDQPQKELSRR